jgi:AcrR family transcriptional regulator
MQVCYTPGMSSPPMRALPGRRPRRGTPAETRARLVAAAARVFNRDGYHGTDSNRIARAGGYAPGTFYKHFPEKRAVFLAAYEAWVGAEWRAIAAEVARSEPPHALARRIVALVLGHHRRWRGLRASMLGLLATDRQVRAFYRRQRRLQLGMLRALRQRFHGSPRSAEEDAVLLFTLERVADAAAQGELHDLGLSAARTIAMLQALVVRHLG